MKTSELRKILKKHGCTLSCHGKRHDLWYSPITGKTFPVPRHSSKEIPTGTYESIAKMLAFRRCSMNKYIYPAIFKKEETGYSVFFPDIDGCYTCGDSLEDAMEMAEDVLSLVLYTYETDGKAIPIPSDCSTIQTDKQSFVSLIKCDTLEYRKRFSNKAVKKTLTIPEWMNDEATRLGINFSQLLQEALMQKLKL